MTAGETAQVEANMNVVHNIMNNSSDITIGKPVMKLAA